MVNTSNTKNYLVPIIVTLLLVAFYLMLPIKYFLALFVLLMIGFLSLIDIRIAVFGVTFLMPFLPNSLALLSFLGLGALYLIKRIFLEKDKLTNHLFFGVIFVYFVLILIQTFTSVYIPGSIRDLGLHIGGLVYLFTVFNTIKTKKDFNTYLTILMASVTFVALIGVIQSFTGVEIQREWLDVQANPDIQVRVFSVFGNPNTLAEYLVMFTPIAVGMFWHTKSLKKKIIFGLGVGAMLYSIVFTMSRGGWIGLAMAAFIYCLLIDRRLLLLAIPLVIGALFFLPATFINRILSIGNFKDSSNEHRFNIWNITRGLIRDHKIAGVGLGYEPFKKVFETYSRTINAYHAHNSFLETIAELGYFGFIIFISMLFTFIKMPIDKLIRQVKYVAEDNYFKYIGAGVVSGIIGVFTHGLVENVLYLPKIIFSFWTVVGIGAMAINILNKRTPKLIETEDQSYMIKRGDLVD